MVTPSVEPLKPFSVIVHDPLAGVAIDDTVNDVPALGEIVANELHDDWPDIEIALLNGAVYPACVAVNVKLEPVPLVAYRSISGDPLSRGPLYTIG